MEEGAESFAAYFSLFPPPTGTEREKDDWPKSLKSRPWDSCSKEEEEIGIERT